MKLTIYKNSSKYLSDLLLQSNTINWLTYKNTSIDLILDGGAFSGSYLLGGLLYISNISKYIHISRISGTSVGSLFGLLYLSNLISKYNHKFYNKFRKCFKKNGDLSVLKYCLNFIKSHIKSDFYKSCNNKLYITYYDISNKKQIIRSSYESNDDLLTSVYKSCFIPMLIDGKISLENKYIDGIIPYIFPESNNKHVLFMDLHSNYLSKMINIKNEKNNHFRILSGILETHHFFMYGSSNLCKNLYKHKYYYYLIFNIRYYIANKAIYLISIIQSLYLDSNLHDQTNTHYSTNRKLYHFIINYIFTHLKHIFPSIVKFIANNYLV